MGSHLREESVMREVVWGLVGVVAMFVMYVVFCAWLPTV
jgi:hypothetical protein